MEKKKRLAGLEKRWLVNNVSIMIALAVICVAAVTASMAAYYYSNLKSGLEAKAKTTTDFFANYINQSYNEYYQSCIKFAQTFEDKDQLELQFISANGKLVASSSGQWAGKAPTTPDIASSIETQQLASYKGVNPPTGERIMAVSSPMIYTNGEVIGVLRYVTSLRTADKQVLMIGLIAVVAGLIFVAFMLFTSSFFIRSIIEPVSQITATAKRIAAGSYGVQIPKLYDDEIGELAQTINDMSVKIGQAEKTQSEFISSVSHELRTPLTAISGWGETLLASGDLEPETKRGMLIILREARRLTGMVEELLEFTRMQDGRFTLNIETADILAEFEDTVFMYGSRLKQEGITLNYDGCDEEIPEIPCDIARMRQVFLNILDNAAKHGGDGKRIDAAISAEDGEVVFRIRDYGPGIPEEELPHVKMKFYKGSSKARGSGIGLAVCEEIVTMHGRRYARNGQAPDGGRIEVIMAEQKDVLREAQSREKFKTMIGGQALIEGILMQGPEKRAIVVRSPEGLVEKVEPLKKKSGWMTWPLIRGVVNFGSSMYGGVKALMYSAEFFPEEENAEPSKFEKWFEGKFGSEKLEKAVVTLSMVLGVGFSVVLFFLLPTLIGGFFDRWIGNAVVRSLIEGVVRVIIFLGYMIGVSQMKDMKRVFSYHGAEHKTIRCYEAKLPLTVENARQMTRLHPRCGTSFLFVVVILSILISAIFSAIWPVDNMLGRLGLTLIVAIAYEFNRLVGRHDNKLTRFLSKPGMWLQLFTTQEPDDSMLEVGIRALELVLPEHEGEDKW